MVKLDWSKNYNPCFTRCIPKYRKQLCISKAHIRIKLPCSRYYAATQPDRCRINGVAQTASAFYAAPIAWLSWFGWRFSAGNIAVSIQCRRRFPKQGACHQWLFAILKNKIIDALRQIGRQRKVFTALDDELLDETFESHFFPNGHWTPEGQPQHWNNPEKSLNNNEFQKILQSCLYNLPENTARVFTLKEILGFSSNEIQQMCGISTANYHTIMHRARESLRQCLQIKWFNQENPK